MVMHLSQCVAHAHILLALAHAHI